MTAPRTSFVRKPRPAPACGQGARCRYRPGNPQVRKSSPGKLGAQALRRHPDRRLRPDGERDDRPAGRRGHPSQLVEERDHVRERHEIELAVRVGEVGASARSKRMRPASSGATAAGLVDHRRREVLDADDLRVGTPLRATARAAGARPEIEHVSRRALEGPSARSSDATGASERIVSHFGARSRTGAAAAVGRAASAADARRPCRGQAREATAEPSAPALVQGSSGGSVLPAPRRRRTSRAALPPLIAIATFP